MKNALNALGLAEGASRESAEKAYESLLFRLDQLMGSDNRQLKTQTARCREALETAWARIKSGGDMTAPEDECGAESQSHPRLGQLCLASGMITIAQLEEAVDEQIKTGQPLGEVLEEKQFISRAALEGLLLGQGLIDVDNEIEDDFARRLLALDLVNRDMILVAKMESKWNDSPLVEILARHGWVEKELLSALGYHES